MVSDIFTCHSTPSPLIPEPLQAWVDDQNLACLHYDLLALLFGLELALSSSLVVARRDAAAGKSAHAAQRAAESFAASTPQSVGMYFCVFV
jgi:hypothetical protein